MSTGRSRLLIRVEGVVQGVGYRPFVYTLATRLQLGGWVGNDTRGVFVEAEGSPAALNALVAALSADAPPLARVERVSASPLPAVGETAFTIVASRSPGDRVVLISPDAATCADCLREMADPADRRFKYPFVNCTHCGPRFTIVRQTPYDRPFTTMAGFIMCPECAHEYADTGDRRFHAQPVCCPACGPRLRLLGADGHEEDGDPIKAAVARLREGAVVAVKGLGGYHLSVSAGAEAAVATLRSRKHREERPFALMVADLAAAGALAEVSTAEADLLTDIARPIVLLRRRPDAAVADAVAPGSPFLGVMLPYTPLHHLLLEAHEAPLVMTSGNLSDEPIVYRDDDAAGRLGGIADAFLLHDRPIHTRVDDSVARVVSGRPVMLRRSRGFVPRPISVPWAFPRHVLGCGPELKNTFCVGRDNNAFVSHHIGDLENFETFSALTAGITHFCGLFDIRPEIVAYDLHPEYLSTKYALELAGVELVGVQHHHAHIVSCLADNGADGPVIGVAFDGLGWGGDGTLWGGEFLIADRSGFERAAHLAQVPLPGGAMAVRQPWRMAAAHVDAAFGGAPPDGLAVAARQGRRWADVLQAARAGINSPMTSSVGRLFDAVAALLGLRDTVSYEGQAAIELERLVDPAETGSYPVAVSAGPVPQIQGADLIRAVVADLAADVPVPVIAARFHTALIRVVGDVCTGIRERSGIGTVALSGGVFQNVVLLEGCVAALTSAGFAVLTHSRVPTNDGGISLGQAVIAGARSS
ncbi:MAG: carbamoyltransferase HypF [Actinomycetota bacterium]|nr:carbamoyltransferase HypF [Actinomycetota bacterium]